MSTTYPPDVLVQGQKTLDGWKAIDPKLTIGALTQEVLATDLTRATALQGQLNDLEARLTDLRNQRDAQFDKIWDQVKRVRAGIKAIYGDDASEYEMIGGTRKSERKKRSSRAQDDAAK